MLHYQLAYLLTYCLALRNTHTQIYRKQATSHRDERQLPMTYIHLYLFLLFHLQKKKYMSFVISLSMVQAKSIHMI